ncbi:DUF4190 domain-containing protein [Arthrobacter rhizosphaerae]|uniref:DUF4190 domain-containing protein n=1 Tax=Arthrobacter rhizosphaerae TaxID=2855490 RepID=UPI001FF2CAF0|nr:DUF4190 domain-containing protein [Arthrobacter rhizosphaerae]
MSTPQYQGYAPAPVQAKTNTLAIAALISVFFISLLGIILGHIALNQIKTTGEGGRGLALAAVIIGYVSVVIGIIVVFVLLGTAAAYQS